MRRLLLVPLLLALAPAFYARPADAQTPPLATAQSMTSAESLGEPPPNGSTRILLRANRKNTVLERRAGSLDLLDADGDASGTASLWTRVCAAPCQASIEPGAQLRIAGEGVEPSSPFRLDPRSQAVRIDADAGSRQALSWGKTLVSTGIGLVALGTVLLVIPASGDDPDSASAFTTLRSLGYGALGAGGALTLTGIPLWVTNGTTITVSSPVSSMSRPPAAVVFGAQKSLF